MNMTGNKEQVPLIQHPDQCPYLFSYQKTDAIFGIPGLPAAKKSSQTFS
jgi:hypothetical protein